MGEWILFNSLCLLCLYYILCSILWLYLKWWNTEQLDRRARTCDWIYYIDNYYEKPVSNLPFDVLRKSIGPEREYRHSVEINCFHTCKFFADIHTHSMVQHRVCRSAHGTRFLQTTAMRCDTENAVVSIRENHIFDVFLWGFARTLLQIHFLEI